MYLTSDVHLLEDSSLPVNVKPSNTIYYDEYPYKVLVEGSHIYHDIEQHYIISDWVDRNVFYRNVRGNWNKTGRSFYFRFYADLVEFVNEFRHHIINVHGPYNEEHLDVLTRKFKGVFKPIFRDNLFYGKYPYKITISRFYRSINTSNNDTTLFEDIDKLVSAQCTDYKWYEEPGLKKQWSNYLYLLEEDKDVVLQVLLLNFKKSVYEKEHVLVLKDLMK